MSITFALANAAKLSHRAAASAGTGYLAARAATRGISVNNWVNELLPEGIELIRSCEIALLR